MPSIRHVLEVIRHMANNYMQNIDRRADDWVVLTSTAYHDGSINEHAKDRVVMTLFNITRETIVSSFTPARAGEGGFAIVSPPLHIDLHIAFMANFASNNYADGLAAISHILSFFQQVPNFNQANAPQLGPDVEKVTLEMESFDPVEVNYVMSMLGTKYLPSVFYKLRLLTFASPAMQARTFPVRGGGVSEAPSDPAAA
ncbi:DUF4255 domain-containing protein [Sphingomonas hengshuiensis]|uniref:Pvc16 N-terminal domain-containing protein n=1 Tax=Sphingomonas hengshuiensis TaxID=1609977 RepID=A0A7U4LFD1_9SPHN|nr:DUF4255 domain-containing protein [Sphingomonas hengshuiensis]AJP72399.1 hypothetical protein TS85_12290 [Sphingomonas hengshuiensis]